MKLTRWTANHRPEQEIEHELDKIKRDMPSKYLNVMTSVPKANDVDEGALVLANVNGQLSIYTKVNGELHQAIFMKVGV